MGARRRAFFGDAEITVPGAERMARAAAASAAYVQARLTDRRAELRDGFLAGVAAAAAEQGRTLDAEGAGQLVTPFLAGQVGSAT